MSRAGRFMLGMLGGAFIGVGAAASHSSILLAIAAAAMWGISVEAILGGRR